MEGGGQVAVFNTVVSVGMAGKVRSEQNCER